MLWAKRDSARVADSLKRIGIVINSGEEIKQDSLDKKIDKRLPTERIKNKYHIIVGSINYY